jgi:hypothetical protein
MNEKTKKINQSIPNRPCLFNRRTHKWHIIGAKFEEGVAVYCAFCYIERMKIIRSGFKDLYYYPHGTWFKVITQSFKNEEKSEDEEISN